MVGTFPSLEPFVRRTRHDHFHAAPEILEAVRRKLAIPDGVLDISMAHVALDRPRIVAVIGKAEAGRVPKHMRMDRKR